MNKKSFSKYSFHSELELDDLLCQKIIESIQVPEASEKLGARGSVFMIKLPKLGDVALKYYRRGGWLTFLKSDLHWQSSGSRALSEYQSLLKVAELGVAIPRPLVAVSAGRYLGRSWLLSSFIAGHQSIADLAKNKSPVLAEALTSAMTEIRKLIEAKIFHTDLHPGNIIFDVEYNCYLIDFDKAQKFKGSKNSLRDQYLCRWRRAVIKHKLPEYLAEVASAQLRLNYDD